MKTWPQLTLLSLLLLSSCGDNSPFDEDYWEDPSSIRSRDNEETTNPKFTANLTSLSSANLGEVTGTAQIEINETDVMSTLNLSDLPQPLMIGQRSISLLSCADIATQFPPPVVVGSATEFKSITEVDNSSRESLIMELNQDNPQNGDSVNLEGKSYVVKAYVETLNTPRVVNGTLVPIACGTIVASTSQGQDDNEDDSEGTAIGGMGTGGTTGGITGGDIGGTTTGGASSGTTGGSTGTIGGTISGTVGGTVSGTTGASGATTGGATGTIGGTISGSVGGTFGGTVGGTTGTTIGGTTGF